VAEQQGSLNEYFSPCKPRAPDLRLILDYFKTNILDITLGIAMGCCSLGSPAEAVA